MRFLKCENLMAWAPVLSLLGTLLIPNSWAQDDQGYPPNLNDGYDPPSDNYVPPPHFPPEMDSNQGYEIPEQFQQMPQNDENYN